MNDKKVGNYGGGGAVQKLHPRKAPTLAIIKVIIKAIILITHVILIPMPTMQELREGLWIDRATRLIIIDFTLYNANINMFCIAKVLRKRSMWIFLMVTLGSNCSDYFRSLSYLYICPNFCPEYL